jgi:hypothetical protein
MPAVDSDINTNVSSERRTEEAVIEMLLILATTEYSSTVGRDCCCSMEGIKLLP